MRADRNSVLPLPLRTSLAAIGSGLANGTIDAADVAVAAESMAALPLRHLSRAIGEIRLYGGLYDPPRAIGPARGFSRLFLFAELIGVNRSAPSASALLARTPKLEYLFLCHANGFLREAALHKIAGPLPTAFLVGAIVHRLNDWVPEIRRAARACLARVAAQTEPPVVAQAGLAMLVRTPSWGRWHAEAEAFHDVLARPDVAGALADAIAASTTGPMGSTLRAALRRPTLDSHLLDLLRRARQPAVRAAALRTLLAGKARWAEGMEKKWTDKSLGLFRYGPAWRERTVERPLPLVELVEIGASDRVAAVRKVAASGLIAHFEAIPGARDPAERLLADRSPAVRERARFALARAGPPA